MEITFPADSVSVDSTYHNSGVSVTVEANGREVAAQLDLDDRLHDLDPVDIVSEVGATKLWSRSARKKCAPGCWPIAIQTTR